MSDEYLLENEDGTGRMTVPKWLYDHVVDIEAKLQAAERKIADFEKNERKLECDVRDLTYRLQAAEESCSELRSDCATLLSRAEAAEAELEDCRQQLIKEQLEVQRLYDLRSTDQERTDAIAEVDRLQAEVARLKEDSTIRESRTVESELTLVLDQQDRTLRRYREALFKLSHWFPGYFGVTDDERIAREALGEGK